MSANARGVISAAKKPSKLHRAVAMITPAITTPVAMTATRRGTSAATV